MKLAINDIIRKNILSMQPYSSARSLNASGRIFLDANEAPEDANANLQVNRYPEPQPADLRDCLAAYYQTPPQQICIGRGSDEAIDLLVRMTCEPFKDAILTCPPTYGMYSVAADVQATRQVTVPLLSKHDRFGLDDNGIAAALSNSAVKLFFICRPNNPTGELLPLDKIRELADLCGPRRLLVVDEAYIEFADHASAISLIDSCPNIVVLRTFSKALALAAARFGVAIAAPEIATMLAKSARPVPGSGSRF